MSKIIKQAKLHENPYLVGDEDMGKLLKIDAVKDGGKIIDIRAVEQHLAELERRARENAARIEKEARERGYAQGLDEGRRAAAAQAAQTINEAQAQAARIVESSVKERSDLLATLEPQIVELIIAMTRKVIQREVENASPVVEIVQAALARIVDKEDLKIRVNPADLEKVQGRREHIMQSLQCAGEIVIDGDPAIPVGGCVIDTNYGAVDARIASQLQEVEKAVRSLCKE